MGKSKTKSKQKWRKASIEESPFAGAVTQTPTKLPSKGSAKNVCVSGGFNKDATSTSKCFSTTEDKELKLEESVPEELHKANEKNRRDSPKNPSSKFSPKLTTKEGKEEDTTSTSKCFSNKLKLEESIPEELHKSNEKNRRDSPKNSSSKISLKWTNKENKEEVSKNTKSLYESSPMSANFPLHKSNDSGQRNSNNENIGACSGFASKGNKNIKFSSPKADESGQRKSNNKENVDNLSDSQRNETIPLQQSDEIDQRESNNTASVDNLSDSDWNENVSYPPDEIDQRGSNNKPSVDDCSDSGWDENFSSPKPDKSDQRGSNNKASVDLGWGELENENTPYRKLYKSGQRSSNYKRRNVLDVNYLCDDRKGDEIEKEFEEYKKYTRTSINYTKVTEIEKDLFEMPEDYSLAHCVAEDLAMGSGIAVEFSRKFKRHSDLYDQHERQGGLAVLADKERFVYYLITKRLSNCKPTLYNLWRSLKKLQMHVKTNNVTKLAIPRIGCGLDRLEWSDVKPMLEFLFRDLNIAITVCNFQQTFQDSPTVLKARKSRVTHVSYPLVEIEAYSTIIYFGSEDGFVTPSITELNEKFQFIRDYKMGERKMGTVIRSSYGNQYVLYCFVVKKSQNDLISFRSLEACSKSLNKLNKQDRFEYIAIEAFHDRDNESLLSKVINILRSTLYDVEIYVCWPEEIRYCMPRQ